MESFGNRTVQQVFQEMPHGCAYSAELAVLKERSEGFYSFEVRAEKTLFSLLNSDEFEALQKDYYLIAPNDLDLETRPFNLVQHVKAGEKFNLKDDFTASTPSVQPDGREVYVPEDGALIEDADGVIRFYSNLDLVLEFNASIEDLGCQLYREKFPLKASFHFALITDETGSKMVLHRSDNEIGAYKLVPYNDFVQHNQIVHCPS